jgi:hypothetical protein
VGEAKDALIRSGTEWLGLISSEGDFTGWVWGDDLDGASDLAAVELRRTEAVVGPESTLRQALEVILNSRSEVAVVLEDNHRYLGAVTVDTIRRELG